MPCMTSDGYQTYNSQERNAFMSEAARAHALTLRWETALAPLYQIYADVAGHPRPGVKAAAHDSAAA